jgi:hypothetical protein
MAEPRSESVSAAPVDTSVAIVDAESLVSEALDRYVELTNDIAKHGDAERIRLVTTDTWATEELDSFAALSALDGTPPRATITRFELMTVRGRQSVVDAHAAVCISGASHPTRVSVVLVPREGSMVIAHISPWKDSTWCAVPPTL